MPCSLERGARDLSRIRDSFPLQVWSSMTSWTLRGEVVPTGHFPTQWQADRSFKVSWFSENTESSASNSWNDLFFRTAVLLLAKHRHLSTNVWNVPVPIGQMTLQSVCFFLPIETASITFGVCCAKVTFVDVHKSKVFSFSFQSLHNKRKTINNVTYLKTKHKKGTEPSYSK